MKDEALIRQFENNNKQYLKIRTTVEEKVRDILSNRKKLLESAALSIVESIRKNPEKYSSLMPSETSIIDYTSTYYPYIYGQQPPQKQWVYFTEDYVAMLSEDADKLFEKLVKELGDEILNDYPLSTSAPSLPLLSSLDEESLPPNKRGLDAA